MKTEAEIERRIRDYLAVHPEAGDTLEGIVEWWLRERRAPRLASTVKKVLTALVAKDFVQEIHGLDGRIHYGLKPAKRPRNVGDTNVTQTGF